MRRAAVTAVRAVAAVTFVCSACATRSEAEEEEGAADGGEGDEAEAEEAGADGDADEDGELLDHDLVRFKVTRAHAREDGARIAVKVRDDDPESDPANWEVFEAPASRPGRRGRPYFHNKVTGTVTWEEPRFEDATDMAKAHRVRVQ